MFCPKQMWQKETERTEASLKRQSKFDDLVTKNKAPIRSSNCSVPLSVCQVRQNSKYLN